MNKISIITVTYNAESFLEKTIKSVLSQDYQNIEYIIVDGKSKDGTLDILNKYKDKISKIISEKDNGIYDAMNKGIDLATGNWIHFLNAGDVYYSSTTVSEIMGKEINNESNVLYAKYVGNTKHSFNSFYLINKMINHQSMIYKSEFLKNNKFDISYKIIADYEHLIRNWKIIKPLCISDIPIVYYDTTGVSSDIRNVKLIWQDRKRVVKNAHMNIIWKFISYIYVNLALFYRRNAEKN